MFKNAIKWYSISTDRSNNETKVFFFQIDVLQIRTFRTRKMSRETLYIGYSSFLIDTLRFLVNIVIIKNKFVMMPKTCTHSMIGSFVFPTIDVSLCFSC